MSCITNIAGIALECGGNVGGIKKFFVAPLSTITSMTFDLASGGTSSIPDIDNTIENVTSITMNGTASFFYTYDFKPSSSTVKSNTLTDNGNTLYSNVATLQFRKHSTPKRIEFEELAKAQELVCMFLGVNEKVYLMNYRNPAMVQSDSNIDWGTGKTDFSGYNITLTAEELFSPIEVTFDINNILDRPL